MSLFVQLEERLAATPGVTGVTASLVPVLSGSSWGNDVSVDGFHWEPGVDANSRYTEVGPGFYSTMGIPLLVGREFTPGDALGSEKVAVVNEAFLEKFGLELGVTVGTRIARGTNNYDGLDTRIVGVVQNAAYSDVKDDVPPVFALPYRQNEALDDMNFYVRVAGARRSVVPAIRREVAALDPNLPVEDLRTMEAQIRENILLDRLTGTLSLAFAALATLLAAVGLYGVLSFAVAQRTREIGVRMALGAGAGSVRRLVLRQVVAMTVVGGIIGLGASLWLGRLAESQLFGVDGTDGLVMVATTVLLATVAVAAGYLPARRASRVDPIEALRAE
jgi:predicted permease